MRVARRVGWLIWSADYARGRKDWRSAARRYAKALRRDPSLWHVRIQLGHALKELDDLDGAAAAYRQAFELGPAQAEALLHLGHVAKDRGDPAAAAENYLQAFEIDPFDLGPLREMHAITQNVVLSQDRLSKLRDRLSEAGFDWFDDPSDLGEQAAKHLIYDATDLLGFFNQHRLPTGIQRVQIEVIGHALTLDRISGIACFLSGRGAWVEIFASEFQHLIALAERGGDAAEPEWLRAMAILHLKLAARSSLTFSRGCALIGTSLSWSNRRYFEFIAKLRLEHRVRYIPFIYDVIPLLYPEFFKPEINRGFEWWIESLMAVADHFIAISDCTASDLIRTAPSLGRTLEAADISVVPLDVEFGTPSPDLLPETYPSPSPNPPYVLMVSTIEPRKNHLGAFEAWCLLADTLGWKAMPMLICVGGRGWLNDAVHAALAQNPKLRAKVSLRHGITDTELARLYRDCICTLYPSFYEGWGLPVTESLCYGKIPVVSNAGSLPEAGKDFALYCDPRSPASIAAALREPIIDAGFRTDREARIRAGFKPKPWSDVALAIRRVAQIQRVSS